MSKIEFSPKQKRARRHAVFVAVVASMGAFVYGFEGMAMNGAIKAVQNQFHAGAFATGFAASAAILGGIVGAFVGGRLSDRIGRRKLLLLVGFFFLAEAVVAPFAPSLLVLDLMRLIGGLGIGAATTVGPGYIAEIAPADLRGRLIATRQLEIILGLFVAGMLNFVVTASSSDGSSMGEWWLGLKAWQWMFLFMLVPTIIYIFFSFYLPESPRQMVALGKDDVARKVLREVTGDSDEAISLQIKRIHSSLNADGKSATFKDLFSPENKRFLPLVGIGMAIAAFQQLTGINVIFFYSNILWESIGFAEQQALIITLITTFVKVAAVFTGIALVDRVGRRRLLIWGGTLMAVSLSIMAFIFTVSPQVDGKPDLVGTVQGPIALIAAMTFTFGFASTWGPLFSVVMGEMFPNRIRGAAMSLAGGTDYVVNYLVVASFPFFLEMSLAATYWMYAFFGVLSVVFVLRFLKETNGMELEDMESLVNEK